MQNSIEKARFGIWKGKFKQQMRSSVLKNLLSKITFVVFLCLGIVFLSAFIYPKKTNYLTRLDLAILMEKILKELPKSELYRIKPELIEKYLPKEEKA